MRRGWVPIISVTVAVVAGFTLAYLANGHTPGSRGNDRPDKGIARAPLESAPVPKPARDEPAPAHRPATPGKGYRARVAIVIDDFALHPGLEEELLTLPIPFTAAVIPNRPHSAEVAEMARAHGHEVLVHMPMAPLVASLGERDALKPEMNPDEVARRVKKALEDIPQAVGVSNHQGSLATANPLLMSKVLGVIRERHMFFLDSLTTPRSVANKVAEELDVPYIARDVFLDNIREEEAIRRQIRQLVRVAEKRGWAVGIGHVDRATARALQKELPALKQRGIAVVPLSELVYGDGSGYGGYGDPAPP